MHVLQFLLAVPAFWLGESNELYSLSWSLYDNEIPLEGFSKSVRILLTVILPIMFMTSVSTSVMLQKSSAIMMLGSSLAVAGVFLIIKIAVWKIALRHYSSASS